MLGFTTWQHAKNVIETYERRLLDAEKEISRLKSEVLSIAVDHNTLRDKVLRKIQSKREERPETSANNSPIIGTDF